MEISLVVPVIILYNRSMDETSTTNGDKNMEVKDAHGIKIINQGDAKGMVNIDRYSIIKETDKAVLLVDDDCALGSNALTAWCPKSQLRLVAHEGFHPVLYITSYMFNTKGLRR